MIVVIEGPDYVGKTTVARALVDALTFFNITARYHAHAPPPDGASPWRAAVWFALERARIIDECARDTETAVHVVDRWTLSARIRNCVEPSRCGWSLANAEKHAHSVAAVFVLRATADVLNQRAAARGSVRTPLERREAAEYAALIEVCTIDANGTVAEAVNAILWFLRLAPEVA